MREWKHKKRNICTVIPARYVFSILASFGLAVMFAMRVVPNVAIVAMVKTQSTENISSEEPIIACHELVQNRSSINNSLEINSGELTGEFDWNSNIQGQVLGSFFFGNAITPLPGGIIAKKYNAKWTCGFGILISAVLTLLTPLTARWSVWALVGSRVIQGLGQGLVYPALSSLIGQWAPKMERSRMTTVIYTGAMLGSVFGNSVSGVMCDSKFLEGWPSAFYLLGAIGCLWFILWSFLVHERPDCHPRISEKELQLIREGKDEAQPRNLPIPWKSILTSVPVWAVVITQFGFLSGFHLSSTQLPMYLANILHFNVKTNGFLSSLPNVANSATAVVFSVVSDQLRKSGRISISTNRKIFNSIGIFGMAICLLAISFIGCDPISIVILLTIGRGLNGAVYPGFLSTHVDMSADFAGIILGIGTCIGNISGFLVPSYTGWLMQDGQTVKNWGIVFFTITAVLTVAGIIFDLFGTAEPQLFKVKVQPAQESSTINTVEINDKLEDSQPHLKTTTKL